jgi:Domain of unknown function (DUF4474)
MGEWKPSTALGAAVWAAGFNYDPDQDIIFSRMDALQRKLGYAYGYDNAALGISAVIDCEPIFFDYGGKHWMIELWKGQYGLETGCEIGVYTRRIGDTSGLYPLLDATVGRRPGDGTPSHNLFYDCAADGDRLNMSLTLHRDGEVLFTRGPEPHWWLTGFKWGVLSRPEDLSVDFRIDFPDPGMRDAFTTALRQLGYADVQVSGNTVSFKFTKPFNPQPRDNVPPGVVAAVMQANERVVDTYRGLNPTTNDPNRVQGDFLQIAGLGLLRLGDYYGRVAAQLGVELRQAGEREMAALAQFFGAASQLAQEWFGGAVRDMSAWIQAVESYLGLNLNFSCIVEIDNRNGSSDLIRSAYRADYGSYGVDPPEWVPKGDVGRFVLHDTKMSPTGSEGSVAYRYATPDLHTGTVNMAYNCPVWSKNTGSVSGGPFQLQAKSDGGNWQGSVPGGGHPLYVRFIAAG